MTNKNNISQTMLTFSKLTNFNRGGYLHTSKFNSLINKDINNAKGGL